MARDLLATQTATQAGLTATFSAANAAGHWIEPGSILEVVNGSGGSIDVTLITQETRAGLAVSDQVIAVGAGARKHIHVPKADQAPFLVPIDGGADDGMIHVDFSAVTSVTVAAIGV